MICPACGKQTAIDGSSCGCSRGAPAAGTALAAIPPVRPEDVTTAAPTGEWVDTTGLPPGASRSAGGETGGVLRSGHAFGRRYHIIGLLGAGGMGEVYRAWDAELCIAVALKVIRPEVMNDPVSARGLETRFKNELLLARQVTHKHVVRIHDLGEIDGVKYITMPCVEGRTLGGMLKTEGALGIPRALSLARQVASGLEAAHEARVVHRDLKPANIMVDADGHAVIMDFGIARSTAGAGGRGIAEIVGTLAYMAPEQAAGGAIDQRADIYAFGLILYEMLVGPRKRSGQQNTYTEMYERFERGLPPLRTLDATIPEALASIVERCLRTDADERFQTSAELVAALTRLDDNGEPIPEARRLTRRLVAVTVAVAGVLAGGTYFLGQWSAPTPVQHEPMPVLVADFENQTGDAIFNGVLEQALTIGIEGASFIHTYPRADAQRLVKQIADGAHLDVERARILAQREGVKVVLAGSIALQGSAYKVTVSTIDPIPGTTLATSTVTARSRDGVLAAVGELASEVRSALGDTTPASARLSDRETFTAASLEAASAYSQGQELLNNSRYEQAIESFDRATKLDANLARGYASWAVAAFQLGRHEEAEAQYKRAFALTDRMTEREKYRTYGTYYLTVAPAYDKAIENYSKLLQLYPSDRAAHGNLAVAYFYVLDFAKAMTEGRRAFELYRSTKLRNNLALYAMYAGDFATARREAEQVIKADPQYIRAYVPVAIAALDDNTPALAHAAYEKMRSIGPEGASRGAMGLADIALYGGDYAGAADVLRRALVEDRNTRNHAALGAKYIALAEAYAGQGRAVQAAAAVREALDASRNEKVRVAAARVLLSLGREAEVAALAEELARNTHGYSRTYGRLLAGELTLRRGDVPQAIDTLREAQKLADLWLVRYALGIAYISAARYPDAMAEFDACLKRRGEATAIFLDDVPTFRYLANLSYWRARAQEGVGQLKQAAESYRRFLELREGTGDALVQDARRRLSS